MYLLRILPAILAPLLALGIATATPAQSSDAPSAERFSVSPQILRDAELAELHTYLDTLRSGQRSVARKVDQFAPGGFALLDAALRAYASIDADAPQHTHAAFQALLARLAAPAIGPYELTRFYSPDLAAYLITPPGDEPVKRQLFQQLLRSGLAYTPYDLAVALCPAVTLDYIAHARADDPHAVELLDAWRRRWAHSPETRPIDQLDHHLDHVAGHFSFKLPDRRRAAQLAFIAVWPQLRGNYEALLAKGLGDTDPAVVAACLEAQRERPAHLSRNELILMRFADHVELRTAALRNYALDHATDHSETPRRIWATLPETAGRERYYCLYAMGIHHRDNAQPALEAVRSDDFSLIEPAMGVLMHAGDDDARAAVALVLHERDRGRHEALSLATDRRLAGFEREALELAKSDKDLIVRLAAIHYLAHAPGRFRTQLATYLTHEDDDLRLAAIQAFRDRQHLRDEDRAALGPRLAEVFLHDPSQGHRNEALYALALWRDPATRTVLEHVMQTYPAHDFSGYSATPEQYWAYRHRLVALLGLALLGDDKAMATLHEMHARGGPHQRMDVLLAFHELGVVPDAAFQDLDSPELKLAATAARLIHVHGDTAQQQRLHEHFDAKPIWRQFAPAGVPDWNLLHYAGIESDEPSDHHHEIHGHDHTHDHEHGHDHDHEHRHEHD